MTTYATLSNMRQAAKRKDVRVRAISLAYPGHVCSADPADYFWMTDSDCLEDPDGNPLVLAHYVTNIYDALTEEQL